MKKFTQLLFAASLVLPARAALAQDDVDVDVDVGTDSAPDADADTSEVAPTPTPTPAATPTSTPAPAALAPIEVEVVQEEDNEPLGFLGIGRRESFGAPLAAVKLGLAGGDYTEDSIQAQTAGGVTWDVRTVFGADLPFAIEGAYVGSSRNVDNPPGAIGDTQIVSNGLEGDLRLAVPIHATDTIGVRPFVFGGVGWQYMTMWGDGTVDESLDEGDNILTIPAGGGIDLGIGPLNVEARATYRHAVGSDLLGAGSADFDDPNALHSYTIGGAIGVEL